MNKRSRPLSYPNDSFELKANICHLIQHKYYVTRCSQHHLKIERVNFWPSTGKIQVDGERSRPERGWAALLALLKALYPRRAAAPCEQCRALTEATLNNDSPRGASNDKAPFTIDLDTMPTEEGPSQIAIVLDEAPWS